MENKNYINYEAAKDLKKLGYDKPCDKFFMHMYDDILESCDNSKRFNAVTYAELEDGDILCPRLEEVKFWLLEKYNLYVSVEPYATEFGYVIYDMNKYCKEDGEQEILFTSDFDEFETDYYNVYQNGISKAINYICTLNSIKYLNNDK